METTTNERPGLSTEAAAKLFGLTRGSISGMIREGRLKAHNNGGRRWMVDKVDAERVRAIIERHPNFTRGDLPVLYDPQPTIRKRKGEPPRRAIGPSRSPGRWENFSSQELAFLLVGLRLFPEYGKWVQEMSDELKSRGFHA